MEKLYVFGTGNAQATRCYNTCFAIRDEDEYFMVDAGGGNGILRVLEDMDVDLCHIHNIFVTHEHTDHILGIVWMGGANMAPRHEKGHVPGRAADLLPPGPDGYHLHHMPPDHAG